MNTGENRRGVWKVAPTLIHPASSSSLPTCGLLRAPTVENYCCPFLGSTACLVNECHDDSATGTTRCP
jgi:hypothetical protein